MRNSQKNGSVLAGILWPMAFVAFYFAAQLWLLPSMGVGT
jgi:hypothetical protein